MKGTIDIFGIPLMEPKNRLITVESTEDKIRWLKKKCFYNRRNSLSCVKLGGSGHMGGALSCAEILGVLYFWAVRHDPKKPQWNGRDRVILSKGHACPMLYSTLVAAGYFKEEELKTFRQLNSRLQGHPEYGTPGVEVASGSLGQGFSAAMGIALGLKYRGTNEKVFAVVGDGELQEGQSWEVIMAAPAKKLDNFIVVLDYNGIQQDGFLKDSLPLEPVNKKFEAFGWKTITVNGHSVEELIAGFTWARSVKEKPALIIAKTIKGFGVSFMENQPKWHGTTPPDDELYKQAMKELTETEETIQ
jgi:transketolase